MKRFSSFSIHVLQKLRDGALVGSSLFLTVIISLSLVYAAGWTSWNPGEAPQSGPTAGNVRPPVVIVGTPVQDAICTFAGGSTIKCEQPSRCATATVTNGTVSDWPDCVVTCNENYALQSGQCVSTAFPSGYILATGPDLNDRRVGDSGNESRCVFDKSEVSWAQGAWSWCTSQRAECTTRKIQNTALLSWNDQRCASGKAVVGYNSSGWVCNECTGTTAGYNCRTGGEITQSWDDIIYYHDVKVYCW